MSGKPAVSCVLLIAALFFGCQCDRRLVEPGGGGVNGVVCDSETSMPIDSVLMRLAIDASGNTSAFEDVFTDSMGHYVLFSGFHAGKLYVVATKAGYLKAAKEVYVIRGDTLVCNLELEKE